MRCGCTCDRSIGLSDCGCCYDRCRKSCVRSWRHVAPCRCKAHENEVKQKRLRRALISQGRELIVTNKTNTELEIEIEKLRQTLNGHLTEKARRSRR